MLDQRKGEQSLSTQKNLPTFYPNITKFYYFLLIWSHFFYEFFSTKKTRFANQKHTFYRKNLNFLMINEQKKNITNFLFNIRKHFNFFNLNHIPSKPQRKSKPHLNWTYGALFYRKLKNWTNKKIKNRCEKLLQPF